jgi:HEAT repeat protein
MLGWIRRLFGPPRPQPHPLAVQVRSNDAEARAKAAAELGGLREPWVPAELVGRLTDMYEAVRVAAREALRRQETAAIPALLEGLKDPRPEVSVVAADLLGELRPPEAVGPLLVALKYGERPLQNAARRALERCGAAALPALWAAREEAQPWVRAQIEEILANSLGAAGQPAPPAPTTVPAASTGTAPPASPPPTS